MTSVCKWNCGIVVCCLYVQLFRDLIRWCIIIIVSHYLHSLFSLQCMDDEGDSSMDSFDMDDIGEMRERRRELSAFTFLDESMDDLDFANAKGDDTENTFSESESNVETADPEEFDLILQKEDHRKSAAFTFLEESMDALDLANAKGDDADANFSESESNMQTADPEEFDLILPKEDHRKSAANMGALWGSVLARTASEKYPRTSTQAIDLGAQQSDKLLTEAIFVRQMVPRSVSAPEIDLQRRSRQARAAKDPSLPRIPPQRRKERRVSLNTATLSAENCQPRKESLNAGAVEETPPLGAQSNPPLSPE
jgi:hypothetical protein